MAKKKEIIASKKKSTENASAAQIITPEKPGKISEFFNHLIAYGGFNFQEGLMRVWGDPSLFIPMNAFVYLFHELEEQLGKDQAHEIFYWLGRLYGKNSTLMLIKRFGADKSNIPEFVNGATQDGMGYLRIKQYDKENLTTGEVIGTNSIFALEYKKRYGKQTTPIDFYLCGMLAAGTEPLFDIWIKVSEKKCMVKEEDSCLYFFEQIKEKPRFNFFNSLKIKEEDLIKKTFSLALKRKTSFSFFKRKDIKFGDGGFNLKGFQGINLPIYGKVILDKILIELMEKKSLDVIVNSVIKETINSIKQNILKKDLREILQGLEIFGYGKFDIKVAGQTKAIISNPNNPYPEDYMQIFGRSKEPVDNFVCLLIKEALKVNNKKAEVKELSCRAKGDKECIFEITFS